MPPESELEALEARAIATRERMAATTREIAERVQPRAVASAAANAVGLQTAQLAEAASVATKTHVAGITAGLAAAALAFELGRWSRDSAARSGARSATSEVRKAEVAKGTAARSERDTSEARAAFASKSLTGYGRARALALGVFGVIGGYVLAALAPKTRMEDELRDVAIRKLRDPALQVLSRNATGFARAAFNMTGVPRYVAFALMALSLAAGNGRARAN